MEWMVYRTLWAYRQQFDGADIGNFLTHSFTFFLSLLLYFFHCRVIMDGWIGV